MEKIFLETFTPDLLMLILQWSSKVILQSYCPQRQPTETIFGIQEGAKKHPVSTHSGFSYVYHVFFHKICSSLRNASYSLGYLNPWSQLVAFLGHLSGPAMLEEVPLTVDFMIKSLTVFPVFSFCFVFSLKDASFQHPAPAACLLLSAMLPTERDPYPPGTISPNEVRSQDA